MRLIGLIGLMLITGCTSVDRTYRKRVKSFTLTEGAGPFYLCQKWEYNNSVK